MSTRRNAARKAAGLPPQEDPPDDTPEYVPMSKVERLQREIAVITHKRLEANGAAFAALSRQLRLLHEELDELQEAEDPSAGMTATDILDEARAVAPLLPEVVLSIYASEWARRHRVRWTPAGGTENE